MVTSYIIPYKVQTTLITMSQYGLISCINNYTHIFNNAKSCIDHIFMKNTNSNTAKSCKK